MVNDSADDEGEGRRKKRVVDSLEKMREFRGRLGDPEDVLVFMAGDEVHTIVTYDSGLQEECIDHSDGSTMINVYKKVVKRDENGDEFEDTELEAVNIIEFEDSETGELWYEVRKRIAERTMSKEEKPKDGIENIDPLQGVFDKDDESKMERMKGGYATHYVDKEREKDLLKETGICDGLEKSKEGSYLKSVKPPDMSGYDYGRSKFRKEGLKRQGYFFLMNASHEKLSRLVGMILEGRKDGEELLILDEAINDYGEVMDGFVAVFKKGSCSDGKQGYSGKK